MMDISARLPFEWNAVLVSQPPVEKTTNDEESPLTTGQWQILKQMYPPWYQSASRCVCCYCCYFTACHSKWTTFVKCWAYWWLMSRLTLLVWHLVYFVISSWAIIIFAQDCSIVVISSEIFLSCHTNNTIIIILKNPGIYVHIIQTGIT